VCRFHVAAGAKLCPGLGAIHTLSGAVGKLACINLLKFGSFSYWFDKPWFHTEGRLVVVLITPSLRVSNWAVIYKTPTSTPHHQYSRDMRFSTHDLSSIYLIFVLALTLTT
jgi:hypothetical protein